MKEDGEGSTGKGSQQGRRPDKGTSLAKSQREEEGKRGGSTIGGSLGRASRQGGPLVAARLELHGASVRREGLRAR